MNIYIVIPAYNEAQNILSVIKDACDGLKSIGLDFKIIIVDDGSRDDTALLISRSAFSNHVEVLRNKERMGVGITFLRGLKYVDSLSKNKDDLILIMEGDGTSDSKLIPEIVAKLKQGFDIVIASRFIKEGGFIGLTFLRKTLSIISNRIFYIFFHIENVTDYTIFYRGYRVCMINKAFSKFGDNLIGSKGFDANSELLLKLYACDAKISEVPFRYDYSLKKSKSKMLVFPEIVRYFFLLLKHRRFYKKNLSVIGINTLLSYITLKAVVAFI